MSSYDVEANRAAQKKYRPDKGKVRLLLVGESPPWHGGYFYRPADGVGKLLSATLKAMDYDKKPAVEGLERMKACGMYLIDAVETPVNHGFIRSKRRRAVRGGKEHVLSEIQKHNPTTTILVHGNVREQIGPYLTANGKEYKTAPFPTSRRKEFVRRIKKLLPRSCRATRGS